MLLKAARGLRAHAQPSRTNGRGPGRRCCPQPRERPGSHSLPSLGLAPTLHVEGLGSALSTLAAAHTTLEDTPPDSGHAGGGQGQGKAPRGLWAGRVPAPRHEAQVSGPQLLLSGTGSPCCAGSSDGGSCLVWMTGALPPGRASLPLVLQRPVGRTLPGVAQCQVSSLRGGDRALWAPALSCWSVRSPCSQGPARGSFPVCPRSLELRVGSRLWGLPAPGPLFSQSRSDLPTP